MSRILTFLETAVRESDVVQTKWVVSICILSLHFAPIASNARFNSSFRSAPAPSTPR
jgi:hypothetical protein